MTIIFSQMSYIFISSIDIIRDVSIDQVGFQNAI